MPAAADDEKPLPSAYTSAEVAGTDNNVEQITVESVKEALKQTTIMDLLKSILKNPAGCPVSNDMEQVVTFDKVHNTETLKNELAEDEPPAFEDQSFEATDTLITGDEPAVFTLSIP